MGVDARIDDSHWLVFANEGGDVGEVSSKTTNRTIHFPILRVEKVIVRHVRTQQPDVPLGVSVGIAEYASRDLLCRLEGEVLYDGNAEVLCFLARHVHNYSTRSSFADGYIIIRSLIVAFVL